MKIILSNHDKEILINLKKKYDLDYIKFIVNKSTEKGLKIDEIVEELKYNFDVEDVSDIDTIEMVWCM